MRHSFNLQLLATASIVTAPFASAHLAMITEGMYCPDLQYNGPLTNMTDPNPKVFDPIYNLTKNDWFLQRGRNCILAKPTGVWTFAANSVVTVAWADKVDSSGYYADGKEKDERPDPFSVTNPQVIADGLVTTSGGISSPNMHCGNKSTAAGTVIAVAYKTDIWDVAMEDFVVVSVAVNTPFERLASYAIPDLAPCVNCLCASGWIPHGYGQKNMYMAPHICTITNPNGGKVPKTPSLVPGPGVVGPKQMIAAFQFEGNNVPYKQVPGAIIPTYSSVMGFMDDAQTDIFEYPANAVIPESRGGASSVHAKAPASTTPARLASVSSVMHPHHSSASLSGCSAA